MAPREALLKPEYRGWYPDILPGIWYDAGEVAATVLRQQERGEPRWASEGRLPSDEHFSFRGGRARTRTDARTRRTDQRGEADTDRPPDPPNYLGLEG